MCYWPILRFNAMKSKKKMNTRIQKVVLQTKQHFPLFETDVTIKPQFSLTQIIKLTFIIKTKILTFFTCHGLTAYKHITTQKKHSLLPKFPNYPFYSDRYH